MKNNFLLPEDDGLSMRDSQDYAIDKLKILEGYLGRFIVSMRGKPWRRINYIDLQAGPGKNRFPNNDIRLGSPLIALTAKKEFDNYWFVELDRKHFNSLQTRITASTRQDNVILYNQDCNIVVDDIVKEIHRIDRPKLKDKWGSLNLAFLDPEGLELQWQTVEKLANKRVDMIINFSTSGIVRNIRQMFALDSETAIDKFFGTRDWRPIYQKLVTEGHAKSTTQLRRTFLDFYKQRLETLGYKIRGEHQPDEKVFRNRRNAQVYTLMFVSKSDLGNKFWNDTINDIRQPRLF